MLNQCNFELFACRKEVDRKQLSANQFVYSANNIQC